MENNNSTLKFLTNFVQNTIENLLNKKFRNSYLLSRKAVVINEYDSVNNTASIIIPSDPNMATNYFYPNRTGDTLIVGQKAYLVYQTTNISQGWLESSKSLGTACSLQKQNVVTKNENNDIYGINNINTNYVNASEGTNKLHRWLSTPSQNTTNGLYYIQGSGIPSVLPDGEWWHLLRMQHAGYPSGFWTDFALGFYDWQGIKVRTNNDGAFHAWRTIVEQQNCPEYVANTGWDDCMKFPNGLCILRWWTNKAINITDAWGSLYVGKVPDSGKAYPSGLFINNPTAILAQSSYGGGSGGHWFECDGHGTMTQFPVYFAVRPNQAAGMQVPYCLVAIGRWK